MKSATVFLCVCGLSTTALAQSLSVHISYDRTIIPYNQSATATMTASFTTLSGDPGSYFAVIDIDLFGSNDYIASNLVFGDWHQDGTSNPPAGPSGEINGSDILGFTMNQSHFISDDLDTSSPLFIASWTVTPQALGEVLTYQAASGGDAFGVVDMEVPPFGMLDRYGTEVFTSQSIFMVPAPASLGVFGAGLAFVGRGRR